MRANERRPHEESGERESSWAADPKATTDQRHNPDDALFGVALEATPHGTRRTVVPAAAGDEPKGAVLATVNRETDDFWRRTCDAGIRELARRDRPFEAFDLIELGVPEPEHHSRWGARLHHAARQGIIEAVGAGPSRRPTVRGSLVRHWRGVQ